MATALRVSGSMVLRHCRYRIPIIGTIKRPLHAVKRWRKPTPLPGDAVLKILTPHHLFIRQVFPKLPLASGGKAVRNGSREYRIMESAMLDVEERSERWRNV